MIDDKHVTILLPQENTISNNTISNTKRLPNILLHTNVENVCMSFKKNKENYLTSIHDILSTKPQIRNFGNFNEIEYSTDVTFKDVIIHAPQASRMTRHYFKNQIELFFDPIMMSTQYFDNASLITADIVMRIDYCHDDEKTVKNISSKLKVAKEKFYWNNVAYKLTAAIELDMSDYQPLLLEKTSRTRKIIYWFVQMVHRETEYCFRVAFRQDDLLQNSNNYLCNIECENEIPPADFIECADLLFKFYKTQYIVNGGLVEPLANIENSIVGLTPDQLLTLSTFKILFEKDDDATVDVSEQMHDFIRYLGVDTYRKYVPDDRLGELMHPQLSYDKLVFEKANIYPDGYDSIDMDNDDALDPMW